MKKMVFKCDMCKVYCEENELLTVQFAMPDAPGMKVLSQRGLMQGTRLGDEDLCPECYQKYCWAYSNLMTGKYKPVNPFEDKD